MTVSGTVAVPANDSPRVESVWLIIPSWMISLLFHGTILTLFAMTFHQPPSIGDPDADAREVGIYYKSSDESVPGSPGSGSAEMPAVDSAPVPGSKQAFDDLRLEESPPVELDLPAVSSRRIGPGLGAPQEAARGDARQMIKSTGTAPGSSTGGGGGGGGGGGTTFFGQRANGVRFLYLLDASGSMQDYNALGVAKAELLASLAQLDADQQFQIVFYSEHCYPMVSREERSNFFAATDVNRTKASQFVRGISPLEGTRHLEALLLALSYNPDVIYFLTDAGEPRLYPADLERIRKRNNEKAQIHTIEFGKHANLNIENNFLKKLSRENRGGYVYRDVTQFSKK